ncbi:MAG TPA: DUF6518 family protein [Candidatus Saccharimonadales bacterium]|nr:DUF6518 family protein [Candidatus Saccharimonadales bacterium]
MTLTQDASAADARVPATDRRASILTVPWPGVLVVVMVGLATGVLTQLGQGILPDGWSQVANAISPWLLVAFFVGAALPTVRWAAVAGIAVLLLALVGYYAMIQLRYGYGGSTGSLVLWGIAALAGGPVFGAAGHWWRGPKPWLRAAALGLAGAVFVAEGVYLMLILPEPAAGIGFALVGLVLPLLLGRSWMDRRRGYLAMVPALALGAAGYVALIAVYGITASL